MAAFAARCLSAGYGGSVAIERLDLDVSAGEIFVLVGASGSGKTTLLKCIGGFVKPMSGRLILDGVDITELPPHRRRVNTMFQSYALFPHLSVAGNIGFGLRRIASTDRKRRIAELLAMMKLDGFARRRVTSLSGGQQQRVALARALAPRPGLLLLDEPFSALDRSLRESTREELLSLLRRLGTTAIMVTHDQDEALASADRIGVLNKGALTQVGAPSDVYENPANRFVARFLGSANVLDGKVVTSRPDGVVIELAGGRGCVAGRAAPGATVALAVRAERLRVERACPRLPSEGMREGMNRVRGVVRGSTYRGSILDVTVELPDGTSVRVTEVLSHGFGRAIENGADVVVSWQAEAGRLLSD